jgi:hypothetical protein
MALAVGTAAVFAFLFFRNKRLQNRLVRTQPTGLLLPWGVSLSLGT